MAGIRGESDSEPCTVLMPTDGRHAKEPVATDMPAALKHAIRLEMPSKELVQMDIVYLGLAAALFAAAFGLVALCDSLSRQKS